MRPAQPWGSRRKRGKGNKCIPISLLYQLQSFSLPAPQLTLLHLSGKAKQQQVLPMRKEYLFADSADLLCQPGVQTSGSSSTGPSLSCHACCRNSDLSLQQRLGCRHQQEGEPLVSCTSHQLFHEGYHRQPIAHKGGKADLGRIHFQGKNLHSLTSFWFPHKYLHLGREKGPGDFPKMVLEYKSNQENF